MNVKIIFSASAKWNFERQSVLWHAEIENQLLLCVIFQDYLTTPKILPPHESTAMEYFQRQRADLERRLRDKINNGEIDENGQVFLQTDDLP